MNTIWFRYWKSHEEIGKTLTGKAIKEHQRKFKKEVHFLIRRSCDLEFHQYLNRRLDYTKEKGRKEGLVIRKHMRELSRFILLDIIIQKEGKFLTTQELLSKDQDIYMHRIGTNDDYYKTKLQRNEDEYQLSYGHLHRIINEYYPELLTTRIELKARLGKRKYDNDRKIDDHRERIVETQFSLNEKVPPGIFELVVARAMQKEATPKFLKQMHFQANLMSKFMMCDPIDLAKLLLFKDDIYEIIDELGVNPFNYDKSSSEKDTFIDSGLFNYFVQSLFHQIRALVELRWFREKSERIQNKLIYREPQFPKYRRKDAKKAVCLASKWFSHPEMVVQIMELAALTYSRYLRKELPKVGLWLNQECLLQLTLNDEWKAHVLYNLAIGHFENGQERLMMIRMKESASLFEQLGNHPGDEADAYGYIAEYWRTRNTERYLFYREKTEGLIKSPILTNRRKAFHYLFLSNCALSNQDKLWEKRLYELGLILCGNDDLLEDFALFFNQCLNDLEIHGQRGPETGIGRFPPPSELDETITSPSFKMIIIDPDSGN